MPPRLLIFSSTKKNGKDSASEGANRVLEGRMSDWEGPVRGMYRERAQRPTDRACRALQLGPVPHERLPRALLDCSSAFEDGTEPERDEQGDFFVLISSRAYHQAAPSPRRFNVYPPKLLRFKSFDGLEIPCTYYHPEENTSKPSGILAPRYLTNKTSRCKYHS